MRIFAKGIAGAVAISFLAGCASAPKDIAPSYVSPTPYLSMSCKQLRTEAEGVSSRAAAAAGVQEKKASNDKALTAVSLIVFWPAAFFIKGDQASAAELARLKGEMQAIEQASKSKNCGITFQQG